MTVYLQHTNSNRASRLAHTSGDICPDLLLADGCYNAGCSPEMTYYVGFDVKRPALAFSVYLFQLDTLVRYI